MAHELNVTAGEEIEQENTRTSFRVTCLRLIAKPSASFPVGGNDVSTPNSRSTRGKSPTTFSWEARSV